jgi:hypothetical protein
MARRVRGWAEPVDDAALTLDDVPPENRFVWLAVRVPCRVTDKATEHMIHARAVQLFREDISDEARFAALRALVADLGLWDAAGPELVRVAEMKRRRDGSFSRPVDRGQLWGPERWASD